MFMIHRRIRTVPLAVLALFITLSFGSRAQGQDGRSLLDQFLPVEKVEETGEIETDRDSFTPATTLVAPSKTMIESSYSFIDNRGVDETHSLPELLIRYGASDWLELRFGTNYEVGGETADVSGAEGTGAEEVDIEESGVEEGSNVSYGMKIDITDQCRWIPDSALIFSGTTPTSGPETTTRFLGTYVFGWELENEWVWDTAIRYGTSGAGSRSIDSWAPSTVVKFPIGERAKGHLEYFGIFSDTPESKAKKHFVSPGVHYLITDDFEIGIRVGWGLNHEAANFFANVGVGLQF